MPTRRLFRWVLVTLAVVMALPSAALAQQGGAEWEDAPPDGAPAGDEMVPYDDRDPAALTDFNAELAPHGSWRDDPTYGRVWIPHRHVVGADFAPYVTSGHWAVADDGGWLWVSDYSWGWAVFHYGRWVWIGGVGWAWIPGRQYAHAWVTWRVADPGWAYVGWAPMPPDYVWFDGVAVGVWFGFYTPWVFCPSAYVYHSHMHGYIVHDHYYAHQIGTHSHRYAPPHGAARWAGPSAQQAHVPAKAVPQKHTPAHPKAIAASRQKASDQQAKIITPGGRRYDGAGSRRVPDRRPSGSRTLPGTSSEPLRSYRQPGAGPSGPSGPTRVAPGARAPSGPRAAPYRAAPGTPSRRSTPSAAPSRSSSSPPSAAPSRSSSPSYRSSSPRVSAPAPVPSYRPAAPAAPSKGRPGRRR